MNVIAEGQGQELATLDRYEYLFAEGQKGELRLYLSEGISMDTISELEQVILSQGVVLTEPIRQDARVVVIKFQKAIAPLIIIGLAVAAIIGAGLLGWQLFTALGKIPWWAWAVGIFGVGFLMLRRRGWV